MSFRGLPGSNEQMEALLREMLDDIERLKQCCQNSGGGISGLQSEVGSVETEVGGLTAGQLDLSRPWAWHGAADLATETVLVTATGYLLYVGRAVRDLASASVRVRVTTALVTPVWAEVAVFTGAVPAFGAGASLTRAGHTNVAATFNTTGLKTTVVSLTGVEAGEDLWVAVGSDAATPFQLRAGLADDLQTGAFQQAAIRPSLMTTPQAVTVSGATLPVPMLRADFS